MNRKDFDSFGDALWWALQTVTTVGYGDVVPTSGTGRVIGAFVMSAASRPHGDHCCGHRGPDRSCRRRRIASSRRSRRRRWARGSQRSRPGWNSRNRKQATDRDRRRIRAGATKRTRRLSVCEKDAGQVGQANAAASAEAAGSMSGRRIMRNALKRPSRPARIGTSSATWRARFVASALMSRTAC